MFCFQKFSQAFSVIFKQFNNIGCNGFTEGDDYLFPFFCYTFRGIT